MDNANVSLGEKAAEQLVRIILEEHMQPGDKLPNEFELAERLGVSRSTIREAVRRLTARNILVAKQGAGTFISQKMGVPEDPLGLTFIDHNARLALELSDVRMLVEPAAAELAAVHATEAQIQEMEDLCWKIDSLVKNDQPYVAEDVRLHTCIGESSGNIILRNLTYIMQDAASISIRVTKNRYRDVAFLEHYLIVRSIRRRDPVGARYAMISHLTTGRDELASMIRREEEGETASGAELSAGL